MNSLALGESRPLPHERNGNGYCHAEAPVHLNRLPDPRYEYNEHSTPEQIHHLLLQQLPFEVVHDYLHLPSKWKVHPGNNFKLPFDHRHPFEVRLEVPDHAATESTRNIQPSFVTLLCEPDGTITAREPHLFSGTVQTLPAFLEQVEDSTNWSCTIDTLPEKRA